MGKPTTQAITAASSASTDLAIPSLSFVKRQPGNECQFDCFAAPNQTYLEGRKTGLRYAHELLASIKASGKADGRVYVAVCGAVRERDKANESFKRLSRHGAADGFLEALETMVLFAAQHADFDKYFQDQLACDPGDTDREVTK